MFLGSYYV
jgi:hypothetical protein